MARLLWPGETAHITLVRKIQLFKESPDLKKTKSRTEFPRSKSNLSERTRSRAGVRTGDPHGGAVGGAAAGAGGASGCRGRQSSDYSQARLIYRADSDLKLQRQNSSIRNFDDRKCTRPSNSEQSSFVFERRNTSTDIARERLARRDSKQAGPLSRESSKLIRGHSNYQLTREAQPPMGRLQRESSRNGFLRSISSSSLLRGNSFQLPRQSSSSQLRTLNRAKSNGKYVSELCTR